MFPSSLCFTAFVNKFVCVVSLLLFEHVHFYLLIDLSLEVSFRLFSFSLCFSYKNIHQLFS